MQKLKEFVLYTKKYMAIDDAYALFANANALGMSEKLMVEDTGSAIAENLQRKHRNDRITFVCGPGGKGAIGMSAARHLMDIANIQVALVGNHADLKNESARFNFRMLENTVDVEEVNPENIDKLKLMIKKSDDVVDAIIGIGMHGRLSNTVLKAIKAVNESKKYIISIDVPSGINADTGSKNMDAVKPDVVLTIHKMKNYLSEKTQHYSVNIIDIGIPPSVELMAGPGDVMLATKPRLIYANKYEHGNVVVVGGSVDYRGAPLLTGMASEHALAALKTGSGYVTIMSPEDALINEQRMMPELILHSISKDKLQKHDIQNITSAKHDSIVIGPGLRLDYLDYKYFSEILEYEKNNGKYVVADASALRLLSRYKNLIERNMVLTPHTGEFKYLSGIDLSKRNMDSKIHTAIDFAKTYGCTLVLKGNETIITDGNLLKINKAETPTLATMGTGDVLSGIIASYLAMNKGEPFKSAVAGVYVHAKIGDILYKELGMHATAYDVATAIPKVLKEFDRISY